MIEDILCKDNVQAILCLEEGHYLIKYDEWKDSENEIIRESAYEDLRILEYIKELEEK